jgi:uncharacterized iron-regulated membrane protein
MSPKLYTVLFLFVLDLGVLAVAVGACYVWLKRVRSPLPVYQRKMVCYAVLLMAACPILGPLFVASVYWLMPLRPSVIFAVTLFLLWSVIAFQLTQRRYRPEGFANEEQP